MALVLIIHKGKINITRTATVLRGTHLGGGKLFKIFKAMERQMNSTDRQTRQILHVALQRQNKNTKV